MIKVLHTRSPRKSWMINKPLNKKACRPTIYFWNFGLDYKKARKTNITLRGLNKIGTKEKTR